MIWHTPRLDQFSRLYIAEDPVHDIPERFAGIPDGYSEYTSGEDLHIFVKTIDNKKYVLTRSQYEFEKWERKLFLKGLFILFAISLVSFGLGFWMAKRPFRPIDRLMNKTRQLNQEPKEGRLGPNSFSGMWEKNEIGELAESFRITTSRLRQLLMDERQFASEVSHELRTPLTVMSTSIELLGNSENLNDYGRQIISRAQQTASRMKEMISIFLNLVRQDYEHTEKIAEIVEENEPVWRRESDAKGLQLIVEFHENVCREKFNAIRYMKKGHVKIVVGKDSFSILDTGAGISAREKERIFDKGYRGKPEITEGIAGYGLELSIVSRICDVLNWRITMESHEGNGTTFTVFFNR
jgi:signal transduction histidine kinase